MKNTFFKFGLLATFLSLLISCNTKKEETNPVLPVIDKEQVKAEIQALENKLALSYNTKNVADAMEYYADDATSYFDGRMPLVGKDTIEKVITEEFANFPAGSTIAFTTKEIYVTNDGLNVAEIGAFKVVDSANVKMRSGNYFSLFAKRDGKYVCVRDMSNSDSK